MEHCATPEEGEFQPSQIELMKKKHLIKTVSSYNNFTFAGCMLSGTLYEKNIIEIMLLNFVFFFKTIPNMGIQSYLRYLRVPEQWKAW